PPRPPPYRPPPPPLPTRRSPTSPGPSPAPCSNQIHHGDTEGTRKRPSSRQKPGPTHPLHLPLTSGSRLSPGRRNKRHLPWRALPSRHQPNPPCPPRLRGELNPCRLAVSPSPVNYRKSLDVLRPLQHAASAFHARHYTGSPRAGRCRHRDSRWRRPRRLSEPSIRSRIAAR